jgi:hypothetical protein
LKNRSTPHAVEYRVAWSQERGRFDVFRGDERTHAFSRQQGMAVGLALQAAQREMTETKQKIIVSSIRNSKRIVEWDGSGQR